MKNLLIVISGPSGVGKGTIAKWLVENKGSALSISCTTRNPRNNEKNGKEYFFISKDEFEEKIRSGGFLEYSEHFGNYYGTPKDFVLEKLKEKDVILEIDVNGGLEIKKNFKSALLIMIAPPSIQEIKNRLLKRNTEPLEKIEERMSRIDYELSKSKEYDHTVINDDLNVCLMQIEKIIEKERELK